MYRPGDGEVWLRPRDLEVVAAPDAIAAGGPIGAVVGCRFHGAHWEIRFRPDDPALPEIVAHMPDPVRESGPGTAGLLPRRTPQAP
jgi:hypothetical protein